MTIQTNTVTNINRNANINKNFVKNTAPVQKEKDTNNIDNGEKKMYTALLGLAVLSLAGVTVAAAIKKGKNQPLQIKKELKPAVSNPVEEKPAVEALKTVDRTIETLKNSEKLSKNNIGKTHKTTKTPVNETVKDTISADDTNYIKRKKEMTKNLNKHDKKIIKDNLAKERADMLKKDFAVQKASKDVYKSINSSAGEIKNAGQGMKSANIEQAAKKAKQAQDAAQSIEDSAKKMINMAQSNPTRKNIKRARTAENMATEAKLRAERVQTNCDKRIKRIMADAARKEENIKRTIETTSPERLLEGQRKMEKHAEQTTIKAIQRKENKKINRPGYQRALNKFQNYSKEKLTQVIASTKTSPVEKTVAQDLLNKI